MTKRIQLSRRKGWRKPANCVVVSRPSKWGNPYRVERRGEKWAVDRGPNRLVGLWRTKTDAMGFACRCYQCDLRDADAGKLSRDSLSFWRENHPCGSCGPFWIIANAHELRGKDLGCWCRLDQPCHADVLLELARKGQRA